MIISTYDSRKRMQNVLVAGARLREIEFEMQAMRICW